MQIKHCLKKKRFKINNSLETLQAYLHDLLLPGLAERVLAAATVLTAAAILLFVCGVMSMSSSRFL